MLGASWASSQFVAPAWSGADGGNGKLCCALFAFGRLGRRLTCNQADAVEAGRSSPVLRVQDRRAS